MRVAVPARALFSPPKAKITVVLISAD